MSSNREKILYRIIIIILAVVILLLLVRSCRDNTGKTEPGNSTIQETLTDGAEEPVADPNASEILQGDKPQITEPESMSNPTAESEPEGDRSALVICSTNVIVHNSTQEIEVFYQNPADSESSVMLQVLIGDECIGTSGLVLPNRELRKIPLDVQIEPATYSGKILISFWDVRGEKKDTFTTEIPVIVVSESDS